MLDCRLGFYRSSFYCITFYLQDRVSYYSKVRWASIAFSLHFDDYSPGFVSHSTSTLHKVHGFTLFLLLLQLAFSYWSLLYFSIFLTPTFFTLCYWILLECAIFWCGWEIFRVRFFDAHSSVTLGSYPTFFFFKLCLADFLSFRTFSLLELCGSGIRCMWVYRGQDLWML